MALTDFFRKAARVPAETDKFAEIGTTGIHIDAGVVNEEFLPELRGERGRKVMREMAENDAVIAGIEFLIEMMVRQVKWWVEPGEGKEEDGAKEKAKSERAKHVQECMEDMSGTWGDFLADALRMIRYGWSYFEIVYKLRQGPGPDATRRSRFKDGRVGWRKFSPRSQHTLDRWEMDDGGGVKGMHQVAPPKYLLKFIPIEKSLHFRTKSAGGNPEGASLLRRVYRAWYHRVNIERIEAIGVERDLAGLPIIDVPQSLLQETTNAKVLALRETLKKIVMNIRRNDQEGLLFPIAYDAQNRKMFELRLLSSGGSRQFDTNAIIMRYRAEIAMAFLCDFILLGHERVGSLALSSDKTALFATALGAILDIIADGMNRYGIPRLMEANGWESDDPPVLRHGDVEKMDLAKIAQILGVLVGAGVPLFPNDELEAFIFREAGFPAAGKSTGTEGPVEPGAEDQVWEAPEVTAEEEQQPPVPGNPVTEAEAPKGPQNEPKDKEKEPKGMDAAAQKGVDFAKERTETQLAAEKYFDSWARTPGFSEAFKTLLDRVAKSAQYGAKLAGKSVRKKMEVRT